MGPLPAPDDQWIFEDWIGLSAPPTDYRSCQDGDERLAFLLACPKVIQSRRPARSDIIGRSGFRIYQNLPVLALVDSPFYLRLCTQRYSGGYNIALFRNNRRLIALDTKDAKNCDGHILAKPHLQVWHRHGYHVRIRSLSDVGLGMSPQDFPQALEYFARLVDIRFQTTLDARIAIDFDRWGVMPA